MPPKEENPGLLSKVVKFVKNPTTNWADLDQQDSDRESSYSKQMLKEMIERKRRNDFVRKREFDMLRKMRRSEVMAGQDPAARPSFFQSSMPSKPDDRATTLKKIDEIEAQMSMQWWKTKHGDTTRSGSMGGGSTVGGGFPMSSHVLPDAAGRPAVSPSPASPSSPSASSYKSTAYTRTEPAPLSEPPDDGKTLPTQLEPMLDSVMPRDSRAFPEPLSLPTQPPPLRFPAAPAAARPVAPGARFPVVAPNPGPAAAAESHSLPVKSSTSFSASKQLAIDVAEFEHDPELEEASIRFANGDDSGAEAGLMEVLGPQGQRLDHEETWLTLFDLYRATGQQDRFETAAIDFAGRFGRSAPQWFSIPDAAGNAGAPAAVGAGSQPLAHWTCPATFGTQTLAAMSAALAKAAPPWRLSWVKLTSIDEAAVEGLTKRFTQWGGDQVQLRFIGADNLEKVLKNATPSSDKATDPYWWKLRLEVLRVMHRPDEFELVALDYCVTYEVSPPSWDSARCDYKPLQADGSYVAGHTLAGEAFHDSLSSGLGYGDTQASGASSQMATVSTVELTGQVVGDAGDALDILEARLYGADVMIISCARLVRIDFSAAGTLLNWVTARQAEGRQVQFIEVHRLVAAFFNVIGISEHARVITRTD
jgi:ABC-type transporter Mla MlaB component